MNLKPAAAAVLLTVLAPSSVPAQTTDAVKAGKWEYTMTTRMPGMPQLPPGVKLPPGVQLPPNVQQGAGGMTTTRTTCVAGGDPTAELRRPHGANSQCRVDRMERSGGAISWGMTCTTPNGTVHSDGSGHYTGDAMEVSVKSRTVTPQGPALEVSNHVVGRYLGPCDAK